MVFQILLPITAVMLTQYIRESLQVLLLFLGGCWAAEGVFKHTWLARCWQNLSRDSLRRSQNQSSHVVGVFVRTTATVNINANLMFRAHTTFKREPDSTDMFQAAGLVGIAKFSDNLRRLKCSEATVSNTTHIFSCGTWCIHSHCTCLQFNFLITLDGPTACPVQVGQGINQKAHKHAGARKEFRPETSFQKMINICYEYKVHL